MLLPLGVDLIARPATISTNSSTAAYQTGIDIVVNTIVEAQAWISKGSRATF